jgi:UTP--glucose-1-phosphate uridylyltransferase
VYSMLEIRKAVFPVAGLGTRFLPATKSSPKEMLAVVDKPLIQYAVEEAYSAGIRHMIFVTGRNKRSIEDHFDTAYELENELSLAGKNELLEIARSIMPNDMTCSYVRQPRALGLGHAVLCARELIGHEPFAVLLADDLMIGTPPVLTQMVEKYHQHQCSLIAVQDVPIEEVEKYGVICGDLNSTLMVKVSKIVEKPKPEAAPSTLAVAGRYIFSPRIFIELSQIQTGVGGEIQLTDGISSLLNYENVFAYKYQGKRYDCGTKIGFLQATVDMGESHIEIGSEFSNWLTKRNI